jgi:hypothetical protein
MGPTEWCKTHGFERHIEELVAQAPPLSADAIALARALGFPRSRSGATGESGPNAACVPVAPSSDEAAA